MHDARIYRDNIPSQHASIAAEHASKQEKRDILKETFLRPTSCLPSASRYN